MNSIFITGANGFIGNVLLSEFKGIKGEINTLSRSGLGSKFNFKGSFFDKNFITKALEKIRPNIIIHLAWETKPGIFYNSDSNDQWSSRTIEFIDEFFFLGGKKFIFMSTCEEYGLLENNIKPDELNICIPTNKYGKEKNRVSNYLIKNYNQENWMILRNYFVSGPNEKNEKLITYMVNQIINNKPIILKRPNDNIDIIDVRDIVRIIRSLIKIKFSGILNLGTSSENTPFQLASNLIKLYGSGKILIDKNFDKNGTNKYIVSDNSKLVNFLKLRTRYTANDTLKDILESKNV